jgi:hypothetical protein
LCYRSEHYAHLWFEKGNKNFSHGRGNPFNVTKHTDDPLCKSIRYTEGKCDLYAQSFRLLFCRYTRLLPLVPRRHRTLHSLGFPAAAARSRSCRSPPPLPPSCVSPTRQSNRTNACCNLESLEQTRQCLRFRATDSFAALRRENGAIRLGSLG